MEFDRIERPLRQMRNLLKLLPDDPAPEQVHMLRTRARRIEAVAAALEPVSGKAARQLVKAIRPVRKAAGGVRDMDVLTQELLAMPRDGINAPPNSSLARLVEHLSALRRQCAGA
ncbi:MAG TPA: CHAD domain-containing protein, partial [Terracidiphilus sp.]|nr:CHAD domain-containing protein [Terracidiphilus sp.]